MRWAALTFAVLAVASHADAAPVSTAFTYQGQLLKSSTPYTGNADVIFRLYDAVSGGIQVGPTVIASSLPVAAGLFTADLDFGAVFTGTALWLDIQVRTPPDAVYTLLTPRVRLAASPFALYALSGPGVAGGTGLVDNGDGTVTDYTTGLMWEKKTGTVGAAVDCGSTACSDPHDVNNQYSWTVTGLASDGGAFTDFLARLNGTRCPTSTCPSLAGHSDWRLPTVAELKTLTNLSLPGCGSGSLCVDPIFGPTVLDFYWSASSTPAGGTAWTVSGGGGSSDFMKFQAHSVRAVRIR